MPIAKMLSCARISWEPRDTVVRLRENAVNSRGLVVDGLDLQHDFTCVVCDHKLERIEPKRLLFSTHSQGPRDVRQFLFPRVRDVDISDSRAQDIQNYG